MNKWKAIRKAFIRVFILVVFILAFLALGSASARPPEMFGTVRGIVHDPRHRPVEDARITLRKAESGWNQETLTDAEGKFSFDAVPAGDYTLRVEKDGFQSVETSIPVASGSALIHHFALEVGAVTQRVEVSAAAGPIDTESATTQSAVSRQEIARAPGASRTNSLQLITDFVPGAYVVHDQLHVRGGHQVSWLVDGVPVPNANIAGNVGPQFDPKDIETVEIQRGGLSADYGDRTYAAFNVITRSGFERNREGELVASLGSYNETNDQLSFGDHTSRFAYYASVNANRTDLGLETPVSQVVHDLGSGVGGFLSLIFNATPTDQLRLATSVRGDHFQIPDSADPGDPAREILRKQQFTPEELHAIGCELYTYFPNGIGQSKLPWPRIHKILNTPGTGRNWNSVTKMLEIAENLEAS